MDRSRSRDNMAVQNSSRRRSASTRKQLGPLDPIFDPPTSYGDVSAHREAMRRRGELPPTRPSVTGLGLEVASSYVIREAVLDDGVSEWELRENGKVVYDGLGDDRKGALVNIFHRLVTGRDRKPPPDN